MTKKIQIFLIAAAVSISSAFAAQNFKFGNFGGSFESAKKAGYDGVQLDNWQRKGENSKIGYTRKDIDDIKKKMKELGMQVCSICVPCYHQFLFEEDKNCVEYMKNVIDAAAELGAENILIPFFGKSSLYEKGTKNFRKERLEPLVKRIKEVAQYAAKKNIVLALENTITAEDNIKLLDMIGEPNVKVYFDTLNIVWTGDQPDVAIKKLGKDRIAQIHIKANAEFFDEAKQPEDFDKCFKAIVDSGYRGWLVLEQGVKRKVHTQDEVISHNLKFFKNSALCK